MDVSDEQPHPGVGPEPGLAPVPEATLAPPPVPRSARRRPGGRFVATVAAGLLVVAATGFAVSTLRAGDGASSPTEAVTDLLDALDQQDAIGVAEALVPEERAALREGLDQAAADAQRVGIADGGLDLHGLAGVDLQVQAPQMTTQELADGVVAVDLTGGSVSTSADLEALPAGSAVRELFERRRAADDPIRDPQVDPVELDGLRVVAVRDGDGWRVSALYSLAEAIRLDDDPVRPYPAPGTEIGERGADSPEAVVREAVDAATRLDVTRLIELTRTDESRVLHTYGPLLVDIAAEADTSGMPEVSDLQLQVSDLPDGRKLVQASHLVLTYDEGDGWGSSTYTYDGRCTTMRFEPGEQYRQEYPDEATLPGVSRYCDQDLGAFSFIPLYSFFFSPGALDVVVAPHDGAWFVDGPRSLVASAIRSLHDLDADGARRMVRSWGGEAWLTAPPAFWEACGVAQPGLAASSPDGANAYERCWRDLPDDFAGPYPVGPYPADAHFEPVEGTDGSGGFAVVGDDPSLAAARACGLDDSILFEGATLTADQQACLRASAVDGDLAADIYAALVCEPVNAQADDPSLDQMGPEEQDAYWMRIGQAYDGCLQQAREDVGGGG